MAAKAKRSSSKKQLEATITRLKTQLERTDAKATRWKEQAKRQEAVAASSKARITKLEKKLAKARRSANQPLTTKGTSPPPSAEHTHRQTPAPTNESTATPDASWTVSRLRTEARSRGLTGLSRKPKAELIAALTVPGPPSS